MPPDSRKSRLINSIRRLPYLKSVKSTLKASQTFMWSRNCLRMVFERRLVNEPYLLPPETFSDNAVLIVLDHGFLGGQSGSQRVVEAQIRYFKNRGRSVHACFVYPAQINHRLPGSATVARAMGFDAAFEVGTDFSIRNIYRFRHCLKQSTLPGNRCSLADQILYGEHVRIPVPVQKHLEDNCYEVVLCNYVWNIPIASKIAGSSPLIVETHDIQSRQLASAKGRATLTAELDLEIRQLQRCRTVIALNSEEYVYFQEHCPNTDVKLVLPSVPLKDYGAKYPIKDYDVIFVGSRHRPNFEGLKWFLERVKPLIPGLKICIAGTVGQIFDDRGFSHLLEMDGVTYLGMVSDLDIVYAKSRLAIVPIHAGEGISIKTIEALAYGLPVVSTTVGLRGFPGDHGVGCFDTPEAFAKRINELLKNDASYLASASHSCTIFSRYFSTVANELGYQHAIGLSEGNIYAH